MTKKTMTEEQFASAIRHLNVSAQTLKIAHGVLVLGKPQAYYVKELEVTAGAISQAVGRVWCAFQEQSEVPRGYERVTAILPAHQAFIVRKWERANRRKES